MDRVEEGSRDTVGRSTPPLEATNSLFRPPGLEWRKVASAHRNGCGEVKDTVVWIRMHRGKEAYTPGIVSVSEVGSITVG
jgi:hypothetical protein